MIGLFIDAIWVFLCVASGLASVRVAGIALNARDRRRHARCLRNIERLEIANGFREAPGPRMGGYGYSQIIRYDDIPFGPGQIIEVEPGAPLPHYVPAATPIWTGPDYGQKLREIDEAQRLKALLAKYGTGATYG